MNCAIPLEDVVIAKVGHWTTHEKCQRKSDKTVTVFALDKRPNSVWAYCTFYFEFDSTVTRYDYIMSEMLWSITSVVWNKPRVHIFAFKRMGWQTGYSVRHLIHQELILCILANLFCLCFSKVWVHTINRNLLDRFPHRPKCLLVFVNPIGGKGNALSIFKKQVGKMWLLVVVPLFGLLSTLSDQYWLG